MSKLLGSIKTISNRILGYNSLQIKESAEVVSFRHIGQNLNYIGIAIDPSNFHSKVIQSNVPTLVRLNSCADIIYTVAKESKQIVGS